MVIRAYCRASRCRSSSACPEDVKSSFSHSFSSISIGSPSSRSGCTSADGTPTGGVLVAGVLTFQCGGACEIYRGETCRAIRRGGDARLSAWGVIRASADAIDGAGCGKDFLW